MEFVVEIKCLEEEKADLNECIDKMKKRNRDNGGISLLYLFFSIMSLLGMTHGNINALTLLMLTINGVICIVSGGKFISGIFYKKEISNRLEFVEYMIENFDSLSLDEVKVVEKIPYDFLESKIEEENYTRFSEIKPNDEIPVIDSTKVLKKEMNCDHQ